MKSEAWIPIVVGVTGHRSIRQADRPALYAAVREELSKLRARCSHSLFVMLSSLAEGAGLLCADAAEELNIPLIAALPRAVDDYEKDFSEVGKARLSHHLLRAVQVFPVPPTEKGAGRDFEFRPAGIFVAAHSHVLLALWDGGSGTEAACGTAAAADFALNGSYYPISGSFTRRCPPGSKNTARRRSS